jgi:hypothetical protein
MTDTCPNFVDNPREQIQRNYARWVDDICEQCDWKTSITMEEVQSMYSKLAIELAVAELVKIEKITDEKTSIEINKRIEYLNGLI